MTVKVMTKTDVLIVGAGPASLAAAELLSNYDIDINIIDEQARPGGQIYRQPPSQFRVRNWLSSKIYASGKNLLNRVSQIDKIHWRSQTTVLGIAVNSDLDSAYLHKVSVSNKNGFEDIEAKHVLIATGCHDMSVVFPGNNLPGVMAAGGIQAFVKSQQIVPGERFMFVGTHPLQLIVADQITQAGGNVAGVVFAQSFTSVFRLLKSPLLILRHAQKFLYISTTLVRLIRAGVGVSFSKTILRAEGIDALESVFIATTDSEGNIKKEQSHRVACDRLGICFSFLASSELARQRGANCSWSSKGGGWIVKADEWMCSNIPGLYVAGEIGGVAGAEVAIEEGRLAGLGIAKNLEQISFEKAYELSKSIRIRLRRLNQFAEMLKDFSYPGEKLLEQMRTGESTLCKCEEISVNDFEAKLADNVHISNANAAKLLSRTGMGLCQGRYCQYHITQMLARHTSRTEQEIGPFTARFPAKPVNISELIK